MSRAKRYWFPAKRYGWGWGLPLVWQGWLVLAVYLVLIGAIVAAYPPRAAVFRFAVLVVLATALLTFVCWLTGEPPRWSWERKGDADRAGRR